ncbi:hypothetical protein T492DRAFT_912303 [Pavlovales sp. CCMP2436]|nr:hypothetical protein T492DRAFT_912303 [Pavlovales sp. CCMP2436]
MAVVANVAADGVDSAHASENEGVLTGYASSRSTSSREDSESQASERCTLTQAPSTCGVCELATPTSDADQSPSGRDASSIVVAQLGEAALAPQGGAPLAPHEEAAFWTHEVAARAPRQEARSDLDLDVHEEAFGELPANYLADAFESADAGAHAPCTPALSIDSVCEGSGDGTPKPRAVVKESTRDSDDEESCAAASRSSQSDSATPEPFMTTQHGFQSSSRSGSAEEDGEEDGLITPTSSSSGDAEEPLDADLLATRLNELQLRHVCGFLDDMASELITGLTCVGQGLKAPGLEVDRADSANATDTVESSDDQTRAAALRLALEKTLLSVELAQAEAAIDEYRKRLAAVHLALAAVPTLVQGHPSVAVASIDARIVVLVSQTIVLLLSAVLGRVLVLASS